MADAQTQSAPRHHLASLVVRLLGLWVLAGGVAKLLGGTPLDLPEPIRELGFGADTNFKLAIGVEISLGTLALLLPRFAWPFLLALVLVFLGILALLLQKGVENCGCFGSNWPIPPLGMIAIDGAFLVGLLVTKPWCTIRPTPPYGKRMGAVALVAAAAFLVPWYRFKQGPTAPVSTVGDEGEPGVWRLPDESDWPEYQFWKVNDWVGKSIHETELAVWTDLSLLPIFEDHTVILWRRNCSHCADHLRDLCNSPLPNGIPPVLIELPEEGSDVVDMDLLDMVIDPSFRAALPDGINWSVTTPIQLEIRGGVIADVLDNEELEGH